MVWLVLCLCLFPYLIHAQDHASLMGGMMRSEFEVQSDEPSNIEARTSFFFGISLEEDVTRNFKFNTFLYYAQKGSQLELPIRSFAFPRNLRLQYIDAVPSIEIKPTDALGIFGGASIGYLLRADVRENGSYNKLDKSFFSTWNYGWVAGTKIYLGNSGITLQYERGLQNILADPGTDVLPGADLRQNAFHAGFTLYL